MQPFINGLNEPPEAPVTDVIGRLVKSVILKSPN